MRMRPARMPAQNRRDRFGEIDSGATHKTHQTERLGAFSDGVFAVIITIMVLDLKPPDEPTFAALAPLWPTALSYAMSYLFIAIVWINHHHLLRLAVQPTPRLIWWNFAHLFMVSLVPFSTAWIARARMASAPVFVYAAIFVLVNIAYRAFQHEVLAQAPPRAISSRARSLSRVRSLLTLVMFLLAMLISLRFPLWGFGLVCCVLFAYLRPEISGLNTKLGSPKLGFRFPARSPYSR